MGLPLRGLSRRNAVLVGAGVLATPRIAGAQGGQLRAIRTVPFA
ncbi:MAG: hypothetical protein JWR00_2910 [Rubritepida sp.]|nr:hypothetical protein [Rubritepida sp.]